MRLVFAFFLCALAMSTLSCGGGRVPLGDVAERALKQSKLTLPRGKAFYLKAEISETTNPKSDFHARIEEYWVSPTKWKRTIKSPSFSQTLVVNGHAVSEKNTGDYFPFWLNEFVTAMVDPLPMLAALKKSNTRLPNPQKSENSTTCADLPARVDHWVICFERDHGLLFSVFTKGYAVDFKEYQTFGKKRVAHRIVTNLEPGTVIEARITELTELTHPDEQMFAVQEITPPTERIKIERVDEGAFRKLAIGSTEIDWPPTGGGPATGGCAVYASTDRSGQVREVWPAGCDSTGLQDPLRESVRKWRLKPAVADGVPVQMEALLGFTFHTNVDNSQPLPELSDAQARELATFVVEPLFPPGSGQNGTEFVVQISVNETGKLTGVQNIQRLRDSVFLAANAALAKWHFKPYVKDGKPQYFHANLVFHVQ
jgi:hypothetical protein